MKMTNGSAAYVLLSILLSPSAIANAVDSCLRDYESRYNADSEAGEALPPMRNLYPDWEDDCNNGGALNEKVKAMIAQDTPTTQDTEPLQDFAATNVFIHQRPNPLAPQFLFPEFVLTSATDRTVVIKDVIVNKGRCTSVVTPGYLTAGGNNASNLWKLVNNRWEPRSMTLDYGQTMTVSPNKQKCPTILEVTVITDGGSLTYDFTQQ